MTSMHAVSSSTHANPAAVDRSLVTGMQELTPEEIDQVHGGFGPGGAVVGAVVSGAGAYWSGGNAGPVLNFVCEA